MCDHLTYAEPALPSSVPEGSKVYKDDCMYSFDTAENNELGLDICLTCYQAFSRSHKDYTKEHTTGSGHVLYLNVNKTLKPEEERERKDKIAKLEIREFKEDDQYNISYSIYCLLDDKYIDIKNTSQKIQSLANSIINSTSANRQEEIKAWEQEIIPCEHSIEIDQLKAQVDLSKCTQCEINENLWICLHCGALGCGRKQFGSTIPGNSHALKHYEDSGHPVAVKLGSLSGSDPNTYDAYCYKCNDEIKIPNVVQYLKTYNIDLTKVTKTEKNLTEINLDQNLNWDFQLDGKDGKLRPLFGANLTGISNLGNSCYLNSVIQALFHLDSYVKFFENKLFPRYDEIRDPAQDLGCQLLKLYDGLVSGRYSKPNSLKGDDFQLGIKPVIFKSLVGEDHAEFKTNNQQDAFEFLLFLLDKIDNYYGYELNEPLKFLTTNKILCSGCLKGNASDELVDNISVNVEDTVERIDGDGTKIYKKVKLIDSFKEYCEDEVIEGYKCDKCNQTTEGIKSSGFKSFPEVLVVNARRIKLENWVPIKVDVPIEVPETIDLSEFCVEVDSNFEVAAVEEDAAPKFEPNQDVLNNLVLMGFPEPRCAKALYHTGNSDLESAMNWILAHMEDPDIDEPLVVDNNQEEEVSEEAINNIASMGFNPLLCKKALLLNNNDPNAAVEWLFANPDDDGVIEKKPSQAPKETKKELIEKLTSSTADGKYELQSIICHKGTSPHTGHYVAFIKQNNKWVLFNDEKVVECDEASVTDLENNAYIYFFRRI